MWANMTHNSPKYPFLITPDSPPLFSFFVLNIWNQHWTFTPKILQYNTRKLPPLLYLCLLSYLSNLSLTNFITEIIKRVHQWLRTLISRNASAADKTGSTKRTFMTYKPEMTLPYKSLWKRLCQHSKSVIRQRIIS